MHIGIDSGTGTIYEPPSVQDPLIQPVVDNSLPSAKEPPISNDSCQPTQSDTATEKEAANNQIISDYKTNGNSTSKPQPTQCDSESPSDIVAAKTGINKEQKKDTLTNMLSNQDEQGVVKNVKDEQNVHQETPLWLRQIAIGNGREFVLSTNLGFFDVSYSVETSHERTNPDFEQSAKLKIEKEWSAGLALTNRLSAIQEFAWKKFTRGKFPEVFPDKDKPDYSQNNKHLQKEFGSNLINEDFNTQKTKTPGSGAAQETKQLSLKEKLLQGLDKYLLFPLKLKAQQSLVGGRYTIEIKSNPEDIKEIAQNKDEFPNLLEPEKISTGTAIVVREEELAKFFGQVGVKTSALLPEIIGGSTNSMLKGKTIGIEKIDDAHVRVVSGDVSKIENESFFGLFKFGARAVLGNETSADKSHLQTATFNVKIVEGKKAYYDFLQTGRIAQTAGVTKVGIIEDYDFENKSRVELTMLGSGILLEGRSSESHHCVITYTNGKKMLEETLRIDKRWVQSTRSINKYSEPNIEERTYKLMLEDVDRNTSRSLEGWTQYNPNQKPISNTDTSVSKQNIQIILKEADLKEIKNRFEDLVAKNPSSTLALKSLVGKKDSIDVINTLIGNEKNNEQLIEELYYISEGMGKPLPGLYIFSDSSKT